MRVNNSVSSLYWRFYIQWLVSDRSIDFCEWENVCSWRILGDCKSFTCGSCLQVPTTSTLFYIYHSSVVVAIFVELFRLPESWNRRSPSVWWYFKLLKNPSCLHCSLTDHSVFLKVEIALSYLFILPLLHHFHFWQNFRHVLSFQCLLYSNYNKVQFYEAVEKRMRCTGMIKFSTIALIIDTNPRNGLETHAKTNTTYVICLVLNPVTLL